MRITRRYLAAASALAFAVASQPLVAHAESADEGAVRKAVDDLTKAMTAADKAQLEALVSDQLSYGHSSGKVETKAEFVGVIAGKKTIYKSIVLSDQTVAIAGPNAIVRHAWLGESESGGKSNVSKIGVLQVWQKQGADWKLLARQAFAKPA